MCLMGFLYWPLEDQPGKQKSLGGVHDLRICLRDFVEDFLQDFGNSKMVKVPLGNPLEKSDDHVPPLWFCFARLAFQWTDFSPLIRLFNRFKCVFNMFV